jgi:predicted dehydrogenase
VVLDLMIHDIDIILSLVRSEAVAIHAAGVPVVSNGVDIANARIVFADGCVANVTASRVSVQQMRKIRVFQPNAYVSIDFLRRSATIVRRRVGASTAAPASGRGFAGPFTGDGADPAYAPLGTEIVNPTSAAPGAVIADSTSAAQGTVIAELADPRGGPGVTIVREEVSFADGETDALALEIDAFLAAVAARTEPPVTGRDGRRALAVANRIVAQIGRGAGVTEWSSRGEEDAP